MEAAEALGIADYLEYEPTVMRGLDYYTGTVLEARDREGEFRAILGGGRYDNLVGDVGGDRLPGVGFAMGDMVIGLVAQKYGEGPAAAPLAGRGAGDVFDKASGWPRRCSWRRELRAGGRARRVVSGGRQAGPAAQVCRRHRGALRRSSWGRTRPRGARSR